MSYRAIVNVAGVGFFPLGWLARLPYAATPLATLILLNSAAGSYAFAGAAGAVQYVAIAASGPVVGVLTDRCGHRVTGVAAAVSNAAALVGLIAASRLDHTAMLVAAGLVGLTQPQVGPVVRARWSRLLRARDRPELLATALSYEAAADEASFVVGPAVVGLGSVVAVPVGPILAIVLLLVGATLPFALLYPGGDVPRATGLDRSGPRLPWASLGAMFLAMAATGAVFGAIQTGVTAYATSSLTPAAAGLVYAELGVGSALAGAAYAWLPARLSLRHRYVTFSGTLLIGMLTIVGGGVLYPLPLAIAAAAATIAPYMISVYALTARLTPPHRAATALTILCAGGPVGAAAGRALAGCLADRWGSHGALLVAPIAAGAALLLALAWARADRCRTRRPGDGMGTSADPIRP
jgi:hypothetical protein